jgi:hypothetical protein
MGSKYLNISFFIAPSWQLLEEEKANVKLLLVKYLSLNHRSMGTASEMSCGYETYRVRTPDLKRVASPHLINREGHTG